MAQKIDDLSRTVGRIEKMLNDYIKDDGERREAFEKSFNEKCEKFDEKYASKRTEIIVDRIGYVVVLAVVVALLALVIQ